MNSPSTKQNKAPAQERFYSPNQRNPYMEKLSTVGMRIRQNVDANPLGCGQQAAETGLQTSMYAGLIVPQWKQGVQPVQFPSSSQNSQNSQNSQFLQSQPPMLSKNESELSDIAMEPSQVDGNRKRRY
ncbi:hypothetical protein DAKH74_031700 [Maudiozyma humilis]|uniref:Uncharacterized protein n=1 Tax=Maudiozyma humilis TaxID=51915 RepID=A0AAV5S1T5_MAUHU|nr:hypothetical protein DAKH74_031700 [Kazachstania humilis]